MDTIKNHIKNSIEVKTKVLDTLHDQINKVGSFLKDCLNKDNKILVAGNGGSCSQSSHLSAELVGRYKKERKGLACIALTTDSSIISAWSNDYSFDSVFSRQIQSIGKKGDVFIALSTSGNSKNLVEAVNECKKQNITSIGLLGNDGGKLKDLVDLSIIIPSNVTPIIQESHIMIIHILCELIEE